MTKVLPKAVADYLRAVERALKAGDATEHTHRPALKTLIEALRQDITATNEPKRIDCGSPDFIVTQRGVPLGYVEAKDVGLDLDRIEVSEQLERYRTSLRNLVLTDYLDFRLYRNGESVRSVRLAKWQKGGKALRRKPDAETELPALFQVFFDAKTQSITSPRELAERMARITKLLRDLIQQAFAHEGQAGDLHAQYEAFKRVLISELSVDQFADMYAQTIAYGLFAARCNHPGGSSRASAPGTTCPGPTRSSAAYSTPSPDPISMSASRGRSMTWPYCSPRPTWARSWRISVAGHPAMTP